MPQKEGLKVSDVVVLIDREQGGRARLASQNLQLHSAFTLRWGIAPVHTRLPRSPPCF
jgi:orotate phosphoribosyltransferase